MTKSVSASGESELIAQELSGLGQKLSEFEKRLDEVEKVNARLEVAALTTARALQEVSQHWDAVYEAMRRVEEPGVKELRRERDSSMSPPERKSR
jgi:predicted nuclease with TOPRIM domain